MKMENDTSGRGLTIEAVPKKNDTSLTDSSRFHSCFSFCVSGSQTAQFLSGLHAPSEINKV